MPDNHRILACAGVPIDCITQQLTFEAPAPHAPRKIATIEIHLSRLLGQTLLQRQRVEQHRVVEGGDEGGDRTVAEGEVVAALGQLLDLAREVEVLDVVGRARGHGEQGLVRLPGLLVALPTVALQAPRFLRVAVAVGVVEEEEEKEEK